MAKKKQRYYQKKEIKNINLPEVGLVPNEDHKYIHSARQAAEKRGEKKHGFLFNVYKWFATLSKEGTITLIGVLSAILFSLYQAGCFHQSKASSIITTLDFDTVNFHSKSPTISYTIENKGNQQLKIDSISSNFYLANRDLPLDRALDNEKVPTPPSESQSFYLAGREAKTYTLPSQGMAVPDTALKMFSKNILSLYVYGNIFYHNEETGVYYLNHFNAQSTNTRGLHFFTNDNKVIK